jgi:hypothetical protein
MNSQELEFLWVINSTGKIFVQRTFNVNLPPFDQDIFSSLVTTINCFSTSVYASGCEEISLGGQKILVKGYPNFQVILSIKKDVRSKELYHLLEEVGEAFRIQYSELLEQNPNVEIQEFDGFGSIIDLIFGLQTYVYIEEQKTILKLMDDAIRLNFSEDYTAQTIFDFLDTLSDYKVEILIHNIGDSLRLILENTPRLSKEKRERYRKLLK